MGDSRGIGGLRRPRCASLAYVPVWLGWRRDCGVGGSLGVRPTAGHAGDKGGGATGGARGLQATKGPKTCPAGELPEIGAVSALTYGPLHCQSEIMPGHVH